MPAFNASNYIERCIVSIIRQRYLNVELIIIDDGSSDDTYNICYKYQQKDSRIKIFKKENEGPGAAREFALTFITGDFITFVDADDYVQEDIYEIMLSYMTKEGLDIVECSYKEVDVFGNTLNQCILENEYIESEFCSIHYAVQKNVTNFLWNKLFRKELFSNIEFPHLFAGEDSCVLTQVYEKARKIRVIDTQLYNYVMTSNSLCRTEFSKKKLDSIIAGEFIYNFYMRNNVKLSGCAAYYICSYAAQSYCEVSNSQIEDKEQILNWLAKTFKTYYNKIETKSIILRQISKSRRVFVMLFNFNKNMCKVIYGIRKRVVNR